MVFQIGRIGVWIPEPVDDARGHDRILDSRIRLRFQVTRKVEVVSDRRRRADEILRRVRARGRFF